MKRFILAVEISGLQQYYKIDSVFTEELISRLSRILNNSQPTAVEVNGPFILFIIESELRNAMMVAESSTRVFEALTENAENLHAFSGILYYTDYRNSTLFLNNIKQSFYANSVDYSLLADNETAGATGLFEESSEGSGYFFITGNIASGNSDRPGTGIYIQNSTVTEITEKIIPEEECSGNNQVIIISSSSGLKLKHTADAVVSAASGPDKQCLVSHTVFVPGDRGAVKPLLRAVDNDFIGRAGENLSGVELRLWEQSNLGSHSINSDYPEKLFKSYLTLYLKSRIKSVPDGYQPSIVYIEGAENCSSEALAYLYEILNSLCADKSCELSIIITVKGNSTRISEVFSDSAVFNLDADNSEGIPAGFQSSASLKYIHKKLLGICKWCEGLFTSDILIEFLGQYGFELKDIHNGLKTLSEEGLLFDGRYPYTVPIPEIDEFISELTDIRELQSSIADFINKGIYSGKIIDFSLSATRLSLFTGSESVNNAFFDCLTRELDRGQTDFVIETVEKNQNLKAGLRASLLMRAAHIKGDREGAAAAMNQITEPLNAENHYDAVLLLEISRYYHASSDYFHALQSVKKALIYLQDTGHQRLEGTAFIELGFIMLCKGKTLESSEYLYLAIERLYGTGDNYSLMKAYLFTAAGHYLRGELKLAIDSNDKAIELAMLSGEENWLFSCRFFQCRIFFELGRYFDAERLLSSCLLQNEIFHDENRRKLFLSWTARACIYQGKVYRGINMLKSLPEDPETLYFLAEAMFFNGNLSKALEYTDSALQHSEYFSLGFLPLEFLSWKNGYVQTEGRMLRSEEGTGVLFHNIRALKAYLLGLSGKKEEGTELLYSLTREQKLSENDPYNRLYFYYYAILLDRKDSSDLIDKLTLLSKALKYLQQTSSRIEDPGVRQEFMNKNYWNARLVSEAKKEKLI